MKRVGWLMVWALLPTTVVLAYTTTQQAGPVQTEAWMGVTLLASFAVAGVAVRRPRRRRTMG